MTAKATIAALVLGMTAPVLAACDDEGPAEQVGESIDESAEKAGDALDDAADNVEDTLDEQTQ